MVDIVAGVRSRLIQSAAVNAVVGSGPDITVGAPNWDHWIFQWTPQITLEGTSQAMLTIRQAGSWQSPSGFNTTRFPRVRIIVAADPDRDSNKRPTLKNAEAKCLAVVQAVDTVLHRPEGITQPYPATTAAQGGEIFGSVRVVDSIRLDEPDFFPLPDSDFGIQALVHYALTVA